MDDWRLPAGHPDDTLTVRFLEEGGQRPLEVAGWLADFLGAARRSLDLAFYDVRLSEQPPLLLRRILANRVAAGVCVRLAYDAGDKPQSPARRTRASSRRRSTPTSGWPSSGSRPVSSAPSAARVS